MTSTTAQRVYDHLPEVYRLVDPDNSNAMLALVRALVEGMGVDTADDDLDRFSEVLLSDQSSAPISWIEWLAPLQGVEFNPSFTDERKRAAVASPTSGWRSGTVPALEDAVRAGIRPYHADGTHALTEGGTGYYSASAPAMPDDVDIRVRTDAHHGAAESILDAHTGGNGVALRALNGDGTISLRVGAADATATVVVPFGAFDVGMVRAVTADSGADKVVTFHTSPDQAEPVWAQLGVPVTLVGAAGPITWTGVTEVGVGGPDEIHASSRFLEAEVQDPSDGTVVLHFDATDEEVGTSPNILDDQGNLWEPTGDVSIDQYPEEPHVEIIRHYGGDPWVIGVITSRKESPSDTSIVANAIEEARSRPAGFEVVFVDYTADWDTIEAGLPTWADWEAADTWSDVQSTP